MRRVRKRKKEEEEDNRMLEEKRGVVRRLLGWNGPNKHTHIHRVHHPHTEQKIHCT